MRAYLSLTRMAIGRAFSYRAAVLAGLMTNFFFGLLRASVMIALYAARPQVEGLTVQDAVTFTGLSQAMIGFQAFFGWFDIIHSVNSGQIGADLLKPMNYFGFWLAQDFGRALFNIAFRGLPIILFYVVIFSITYPDSPGGWLVLVISLLLAWLVSFSFRFLINLSAFWIPNAVGVSRLFFAVSWLFSGFLLPLRFFPEWLARLTYLTPFPHMVNTSVEIYLGLLTPTEMFRALLLQTFWCIVLIAAGHMVLAAGVRRLVIQGG